MTNLLVVLCIALLGSIAHGFTPRLINGEVVEVPQIVNINTNGAGCTATVIGKRKIITAAHCANTGAVSRFSINGVSYSAKMKRSPLYPAQDHDICVGVTGKDISVSPMKVVSQLNVVEVGVELEIFGYGCVNPGGSGWDGNLRKGTAEVTGFSGFGDAVSQHGSALCYGDSGGPAFLNGELVTINSKGDIRNTNYTARLDTVESQEFLKSFE